MNKTDSLHRTRPVTCDIKSSFKVLGSIIAFALTLLTTGIIGLKNSTSERARDILSAAEDIKLE